MFKKIRIISFVFLLLFPIVGLEAQRVSRREVPDAVMESFHLAHPHPFFRFVEWERSDVGYCSRIVFPQKEISSLFQANGEWVSTRWLIHESSLPLKAHDLISEKYAFYQLRSCMYEEDRWHGRHYYVLFSIYGIEGYMTELCFDLKGDLVSIDGQEIEDWEEFEPLNEEEVLELQESGFLVHLGPDGDSFGEEDSVGAIDQIGFFIWAKSSKEMQDSKESGTAGEKSIGRKIRGFFTGKFKPEKAQDSTGEEKLLAKQEEKRKGKGSRQLYRPQTREEFSRTKVLLQSRTARQREEEHILVEVRDSLDMALATAVENGNEVEESLPEESGRQEDSSVRNDEESAAASDTEAETGMNVDMAVGMEVDVDMAVDEDTGIGKETVSEGAFADGDLSDGGNVSDRRSGSEGLPDEDAGSVSGNGEEELAAVQPEPVRSVSRDTADILSMQGAVLADNAMKLSIKTIFPEPIQKVFAKRFPKAENVKYYRDTSGDYRAVFSNYGQKAEAVFLADATHITTALFFGKKEMSYPIQQYIENAPENYRFVTGKRIVYESRYRQRFPAAQKPQNYYQVVVWKKEKKQRERHYFLLTFNQKAHFVSAVPYDYVGSSK